MVGVVAVRKSKVAAVRRDNKATGRGLLGKSAKEPEHDQENSEQLAPRDRLAPGRRALATGPSQGKGRQQPVREGNLARVIDRQRPIAAAREPAVNPPGLMMHSRRPGLRPERHARSSNASFNPSAASVERKPRAQAHCMGNSAG
jgi:hypothetical protein